MILFKRQHAPLILDGTKTQTRRIWSKGPRAKVGAVHQCRLSQFGKPFAHIRILDVRQEKLGRISPEDALREGYRDRDEYLEAFARINGLQLSELHALPPVYVVSFELAVQETE